MTVPMYFLLLAAICVAVRAMFGLATLSERRRERRAWRRLVDELWDDDRDQAA